jgi:hypothetical protein
MGETKTTWHETETQLEVKGEHHDNLWAVVLCKFSDDIW